MFLYLPEITQNGVVGGTQTLSTMGFYAKSEDLNQGQSANASIFEKNNGIVIENKDRTFKSDVDICSPSSSTTPYDFDFRYNNIENTFCRSKHSNIKLTSSYINLQAVEKCDPLHPMQLLCPIKLPKSDLKSKHSLVKTSISMHLTSVVQCNEFCIGQQIDVKDDGNSIVDAKLPPICGNGQSKENSFPNENYMNNDSPTDLIESMLCEMLNEMKDIEDYISAYISSFCILEEEFDNYAAIQGSSKVISQFLNEVQSSGVNKTESKNEQDPNSKFELEDQSNKNCLNKSSNPTFSNDSLLDDEALSIASLEMATITSRNNVDKLIPQETFLGNNTALAPLRVFENIWKNTLESCSDDYVLQRNFFSNDDPFSQYCPSASMDDSTAVEEGETIVHAFDSFLNNYLNTDIRQYIRCTITELDDDNQEPFSMDGESNYAVIDHEIKSNHKFSDTHSEWNEMAIILQSSETTCSTVNKHVIKGLESNEDSANFLNASNKKIESDYEKTASSSESNTELIPLMEKVTSDLILERGRPFEPLNHKYMVFEETHKINNQRSTNQNPEHFKTENLSMKGPQTCKQNPKNTQLAHVGSPVNVHSTIMSSSKYRGNSNDALVKTLQESITSELSEKKSNRSRFINVQEDSNGNSPKTNTNYLFSSPDVQLNLTNPLSNEKK